MNFTDKDKEKLIQFLNFVATKAEFNNLKTNDIILFYNLLSFMQKELLPKVESHIFEIKGTVEMEKDKPKKSSKSSKE